MKVYHYDVFTKVAGKGNPAGVVFDADHLSDDEMQAIAKKVGFNETAFLLTSKDADLKIRYFTPGHEMNLCGHGTVASLYALHHKTKVSHIRKIETKAGMLSVNFVEGDNGNMRIEMAQANPKFMPFEGSLQALARVLDIDSSEISETYPVLYGSTGIWTLLVPIKSIETFKKMKPISTDFPSVLSENSKASIHPFCFETYDPLATIHARHFSSPFSGTIEDAVTGTASGVLGAYYLNFVKQGEQASIIVEQGYEIHRDGRVHVAVNKNDACVNVRIMGDCAFNRVIEIT